MRLIGFAWVFGAAAGFGFTGIFARLAYDHGGNVSGVIVARALAALPLLMLFAVIPGNVYRRSEARDCVWALLAMALMFVAMVVTFMVAVSRMSPALVVLVVYTYPALTMLGSWLLGRMPITGLAMISTALTVVGVAVTMGLPAGEIDPIAVTFALLNAIACTAYFLLAQRVLRAMDPLTAYAAIGGISGALLLAGAFFLADPGWPSGAVGLASLVAIGVISTVVANVALLRGIRRLGSAPAAVVATLEIVTVLTASVILFDQAWSLSLIVGSLLILLGASGAPLATGLAREMHGRGSPRSRPLCRGK